MKHRVFIIIELLIVVAIISILTTVGMVISYKTDKFQDLQKKFGRQKEYKERLYNQG
jgi:type II secretory pathway pseudopilin PulG|tara:strand:- start:332 stop:502 length:171 start_codon:yes stop_codon:yes gene_type:complete